MIRRDETGSAVDVSRLARKLKIIPLSGGGDGGGVGSLHHDLVPHLGDGAKRTIGVYNSKWLEIDVHCLQTRVMQERWSKELARLSGRQNVHHHWLAEVGQDQHQQ